MRKLIITIISATLVTFACSCSTAEPATNLPKQLKDLKATKVIALSSLACAITNNKNVYCWKLNTKKNEQTLLFPVNFGETKGHTVVQIFGQGSTSPGGALETGDYACATFASGKIMCWGNTYYKDGLMDAEILLPGLSPEFDGDSLLAQTLIGKGFGSMHNTPTPKLILSHNVVCSLSSNTLYCPHAHLLRYSGLKNIQDAFFGGDETCLIDKKNTLRCYTELGDFDQMSANNVIFKRENVKSYTAETLAGSGLCIIDTLDSAYCNAPLISPTSTDTWDLKLVRKHVKAVTVTESHACTLLKDGSVYCWGLNYHNQIDPTHTDEIPAPGQKIPLRGKVIQQAIGPGYSCFLLEDESIECIGKSFELED